MSTATTATRGPGRWKAAGAESYSRDAASNPIDLPTQVGGEKGRGTRRLSTGLKIALDRLVPDPEQPRKTFDPEEITALAGSLRQFGQLQPALVRWGGTDWILIDGERRYRAAKEAGFATLDCIEAEEGFSPDDLIDRQLTANCQRKDLNKIDMARAYLGLMNRRGWSHSQLAEHLSLDKSTVSRLLDLLRLDPDVQRLIQEGQLSPSTVRSLKDLTPEAQREVAAEAVADNLSREEVERRVNERRDEGHAPASKPRAARVRPARYRAAYELADGTVTVVCKDPEARHPQVIALLQEALAQALGATAPAPAPVPAPASDHDQQPEAAA